MAFGSGLQAALEAEVVHLFFAVELLHPVKTVRLLDGAGALTFSGHDWVGIDDDFGALGALEALEDSAGGDDAPELLLHIRPANGAVPASLAAVTAQGRHATVYLGAYNPATGAVVGTPEVVFAGVVDDIDLVLDAAMSVVSFTLVSDLVRFQAPDEAMTLSDSFHQSVWPGEEGLEFMTEVEQQMPWGAEGARPEVVAVQGVIGRIFRA
jgi:hypothetical protein